MFTSHDHRGLLEGQSLRKPTSSVRKGRDRGLKACRRSNTQAVKLDAQLSSRGEVRFHLLCVFTSSAPPSGERPHHPTARHGRVFTSANRLQSSCTRASVMHSSALASTHTSTPAPREESLLFFFNVCDVSTFRRFRHKRQDMFVRRMQTCTRGPKPVCNNIHHTREDDVTLKHAIRVRSFDKVLWAGLNDGRCSHIFSFRIPFKLGSQTSRLKSSFSFPFFFVSG